MMFWNFPMLIVCEGFWFWQQLFLEFVPFLRWQWLSPHRKWGWSFVKPGIIVSLVTFQNNSNWNVLISSGNIYSSCCPAKRSVPQNMQRGSVADSSTPCGDRGSAPVFYCQCITYPMFTNHADITWTATCNVNVAPTLLIGMNIFLIFVATMTSYKKSSRQAVVTFLLDHLTQKTRWKTARFRVFSLGQSGVACFFVFFQGVLGANLANEILPVCWSKVQHLRLKNYLVPKKFFAWEKGWAWEKCFTGWCSAPTLLRPFARHLGPGKLSSIDIHCSFAHHDQHNPVQVKQNSTPLVLLQPKPLICLRGLDKVK